MSTLSEAFAAAFQRELCDLTDAEVREAWRAYHAAVPGAWGGEFADAVHYLIDGETDFRMDFRKVATRAQWSDAEVYCRLQRRREAFGRAAVSRLELATDTPQKQAA